MVIYENEPGTAKMISTLINMVLFIMILGMHTNTFKVISDNRFLPVSYMTQEFRT